MKRRSDIVRAVFIFGNDNRRQTPTRTTLKPPSVFILTDEDVVVNYGNFFSSLCGHEDDVTVASSCILVVARRHRMTTINPKDKTYLKFDTVDDLFRNNFIDLETPNPKSQMPEFETIAEDSLKNRFDIKIAKQQINVAEKNLTVIARQRIPDLEIQGGYGYQSKGMSDDGRFKAGAYAGASLVNLPLLYAYRPEIKNAKLEVEKAELNYISTKNKALKDLNNAYEKFG